MKGTYNILIIDDHKILIEAYKNTLNSYLPERTNYEFNIDAVNDCSSALRKLSKHDYPKYYNLILLEISIPPCQKNELNTGEELGVYIKRLFPDIKIIVITSCNDNFRINHILKTINPDGLLLKNEIAAKDLSKAVESVINGTPAYSNSVVKFFRKRITNINILDHIDIRILLEISNGTRSKDLIKYIPLSKAGIEKRKRILKECFNIQNDSDRELILSAREKGFI